MGALPLHQGDPEIGFIYLNFSGIAPGYQVSSASISRQTKAAGSINLTLKLKPRLRIDEWGN